MSRQVVLDTETTGLDPKNGHRIIEIGALELVNRRLTGGRYHVYINPQRFIDPGAIKVHGLTNDFLADKPLFGNIVDDLLKFIDGAELIIHNAPFDVGFLNHEFALLAPNPRRVEDHCQVFDTLPYARKAHPGQRNSLDALCKRYDVDNSDRTLHGALIDAELLAHVYLAMTGGQGRLFADPKSQTTTDSAAPEAVSTLAKADYKVVQASDAELSAHQAYLQFLSKQS